MINEDIIRRMSVTDNICTDSDQDSEQDISDDIIQKKENDSFVNSPTYNIEKDIETLWRRQRADKKYIEKKIEELKTDFSNQFSITINQNHIDKFLEAVDRIEESIQNLNNRLDELENESLIELKIKEVEYKVETPEEVPKPTDIKKASMDVKHQYVLDQIAFNNKYKKIEGVLVLDLAESMGYSSTSVYNFIKSLLAQYPNLEEKTDGQGRKVIAIKKQ